MNNEAPTFSARSGKDRVTYCFETQEGTRPIKLGDGTFGCVFHVRDSKGQSFALKIFYKTDDKRVLNSQQAEMSVGEELHKHYADIPELSASVSRYVVVPLAVTRSFTNSPAFRKFEEYFNKLSYRISNKAIIMDYYPMSLKDLLERGWPTQSPSKDKGKADNIDAEPEESNVGRGLGGKFGKRPGYDALEAISQTNREKSMLPILEDVAQALSLLHGPNLRHQDIKPANILIRRVGANIEAAIADLGFLDTGTHQFHGSRFQHEPAGTRHYRSPEQTDCYDVCEVDIRNGECGTYVLSTTDPKFRDTFSEPGDFVVFSKLEDKTQWEIQEINFPEPRSESDSEFEVAEANAIEIIIPILEGVKLEPDQRTQITINKRQTVRTDIFGIGAIAYDMLTGGRSPERFYDMLRARDTTESKIRRDLILRYSNYKNGGGAVIEIDNIFQSLRFNSNSGYPSEKMVSFILKTMMSRPEDSYYSHAKNNLDDVWSPVLDDLENLYDGHERHRNVRVNLLTSGVLETAPEPPSLPERELSEIQQLGYDDAESAATRLVRGSRYLLEIGEMISDLIKLKDHGSFLVDVSPSALLRDSRHRIHSRITFFENRQDFEEVMVSGNPRIALQGLASGNLLPPFIHGIVRDGEVWRDNACQGNEFAVRYDIWGADYGCRALSPGDRLLFDFSAESRKNVHIKEVGKHFLELDSNAFESDFQIAEGRRHKVSFFKTFEPVDYYVAMLGVYVRLVFFVNPKDRRQYTPQAAYVLEQSRTGGFSNEFVSRIKPMLNRTLVKLTSKRSLPTLFKLFACYYLCLLTRETNPMLGNDGDYRNETVNVSKLVRDMVKLTAKAIGADVDDFIFDSENKLLDKARTRRLSQRSFPDIEQLTEKIVKEWLT